MGKKKNNSNDESFKNNPFTSVKGFSVSKSDVKVKVEKPIEKKAAVTTAADDSETDFSRAMEQLGVESFGEDETVMVRDVAFADSPDDADDTDFMADDNIDNVDGAVDDDALFVASLGQLDSVFNDNFPDDDESVERAEPRRMKQLRQGKLRPQATLDLHGCYRDEARKKVRHFLQNRYAEGLTTVLIVTGRGNRSPGGESVLRSDIERYLTTYAGAWVAEWGRAPRQYGGDGALVVFLRRTKS